MYSSKKYSHWAEVQLHLEQVNTYYYFMLSSTWLELCTNFALGLL